MKSTRSESNRFTKLQDGTAAEHRYSIRDEKAVHSTGARGFFRATDRGKCADRSRLDRNREPSCREMTFLERTVNGQPGFVARQDGAIITVFAFDIVGERIKHIWVVRNPEKLRSWMSHWLGFPWEKRQASVDSAPIESGSCARFSERATKHPAQEAIRAGDLWSSAWRSSSPAPRRNQHPSTR
jgi:hypothetical protein